MKQVERSRRRANRLLFILIAVYTHISSDGRNSQEMLRQLIRSMRHPPITTSGGIQVIVTVENILNPSSQPTFSTHLDKTEDYIKFTREDIKDQGQKPTENLHAKWEHYHKPFHEILSLITKWPTRQKGSTQTENRSTTLPTTLRWPPRWLTRNILYFHALSHSELRTEEALWRGGETSSRKPKQFQLHTEI